MGDKSVADTSGYWVHESGRWLQIFDHLSELRLKPEAFGFTRPELQVLLDGTPAGKRRRVVLTEAMRRGWTRVRFTRERRVAEFWEGTGAVLAALGKMLTETNAWPSEKLELHELSTTRVWSVEAGRLMKEAE